MTDFVAFGLDVWPIYGLHYFVSKTFYDLPLESALFVSFKLLVLTYPYNVKIYMNSLALTNWDAPCIPPVSNDRYQFHFRANTVQFEYDPFRFHITHSFILANAIVYTW